MTRIAGKRKKLQDGVLRAIFSKEQENCTFQDHDESAAVTVCKKEEEDNKKDEKDGDDADGDGATKS